MKVCQFAHSGRLSSQKLSYQKNTTCLLQFLVMNIDHIGSTVGNGDFTFCDNSRKCTLGAVLVVVRISLSNFCSSGTSITVIYIVTTLSGSHLSLCCMDLARGWIFFIHFFVESLVSFEMVAWYNCCRFISCTFIMLICPFSTSQRDSFEIWRLEGVGVDWTSRACVHVFMQWMFSVLPCCSICFTAIVENLWHLTSLYDFSKLLESSLQRWRLQVSLLELAAWLINCLLFQLPNFYSQCVHLLALAFFW